MSGAIEVVTLTDGGQDPATIAARLAAFFDGAWTLIILPPLPYQPQ